MEARLPLVVICALIFGSLAAASGSDYASETTSAAYQRHLVAGSSTGLRIFAEYLETPEESEGSRFTERFTDVLQWLGKALHVPQAAGSLRLAGNETCAGRSVAPLIYRHSADIVVFVSGNSSLVDAHGYACTVEETGLNRVIAGGLEVNWAGLAALPEPHQRAVLAREVTRILGFDLHLFAYFNSPTGGKVTIEDILITREESGRNVTYVASPTVAEFAQRAFGCPTAIGVPVEFSEKGLAWAGRVMFNDYMSTYPLSNVVLYTEVTLAVLQDSGWYEVAWDYADAVGAGRDQGCGWLSRPCVESGVAQFPAFCSVGDQAGCDALHFSKGRCDLRTYNDSLPAEFQYFAESTMGGQAEMQYCPVVIAGNDSDCRGLGLTPQGNSWEEVCPTCRCFEGDYADLTESATSAYLGAQCQRVDCNGTHAIVHIRSEEVPCPPAGGEVAISGFSGNMLCPPFAVLCEDVPCPHRCSDRGICSNGVCQCAAPWYGEMCEKRCSPTCATCADAETCLACKANATLSASGTCECDEGLEMNADGVCAYPGTCADFCEECVGPAASECLRCAKGATMHNSTSCECMPGAYAENGECKECGHLCETCTSASNCTSCFSFAHYSAENDTCVCNSGRETPEGWCESDFDGNWTNCHNNSTSCTQCPANSHLSEWGSCECDANFYTLTNASACVQCPAGEANCTSCHPTEVFKDGFCQCAAGFHYDFWTHNCTVDCARNCFTCLPDNATECLSCESGAVLNNDTHACECEAGFYQGEHSCEPCGRLCAECSSEGQCLACAPEACFTNSTNSTCECREGTVFNWFLWSCQPFNGTYTDSTCWRNSYPANDTCVCHPGFYSPGNSTECLGCASSCQSCQGSADFCTSCPLFSELNATTGQCTCGNSTFVHEGQCWPCPSECDGCTDLNNCESCKPTAQRVNNTCTCPAGSKWSDLSDMCCHESCQSCSQPEAEDACLTCPFGANLTESGKCKCGSGSYWNEDWQACLKCPFGCDQCEGANCTTCQPNTHQNQTSGECLCDDGFYAFGSSCEACFELCATCDWLFNCTSCPLNSHLTESSTCECDTGFYTMTNVTACVMCPEGDVNCTSCGPNETFKGGLCHCAPGYHSDFWTGNCTIDCAPNCRSCLPDNATECLSCVWGAELNNDTHSCDCVGGFYLKGNYCEPCGMQCAECSSDGQCLACVPGAYFTNSTCECGEGTVFDWDKASCQPFNETNSTCGPNAYKLNETCLCYPGFFSSDNSTECIPCAPTCETCRGSADFCTSCSLFAELNATSGQCTCTNSSYADETLGKCWPCPFECDGCTDVNNCLNCRPTAERVNNTCTCPRNSTWSDISEMCCHETCRSCSQPYAEDTCLTCPLGANLTSNGTCACESGFYWNPSWMTCANCSFECAECEGPSCTLCKPSATLNSTSGECVCNDGFYAAGTGCWECSDACETCDWWTNCTSCPLFAHLTENSTCECNAGFYTMTNTSACILCSEADCASCGPNEVLIDGYCRCKSGYHNDYWTGNCTIDCAPNCRSCLPENVTVCFSCEWGSVLNNDTHSCDCMSGFYLNASYCVPCGKLCGECSSDGQCLTCVSGANFTNSTCECSEGTIFDWYTMSCQAYNGSNSTCGRNAYYANETCLCYPGYFIPDNSTECMKCASACVSCQGSADFCTSCSLFAELNVTSGQCTCTNSSYADETLGMCWPCPSECDGCTDANNCLNCKPTAERVNNTCICPANSTWSDVSEMCCHETCDSCSQPFVHDACLNCSGNAFVTVNGTCECNSGFFWNQTWMGCDSCPFGCEECDGSNCIRCQPNTYQNQTTGECSCNDGYFKAWNECSRCSDACATCDWWTNCTSCPFNSHLTENSTCECDAGFYTMTNTSACILCSEADCASCGPNGVLIDGYCRCKSGYHNDYWTGNCTIDCAPNCRSCLPDNATVCSSCEWGAILNNDTHSCDCMSGFYLNASYCVPCGELCGECSSDGQCLACVSGANFTNSTCECSEGTTFDWYTMSCQAFNGTNSTCGMNAYYANETCLCYPGYFLSANSTDCMKCSPACVSCQGSADFCTSCSLFAELNATSGQCTCTNSSYADETLGMCLPCPFECDGCTDANNCLNCKPTTERVNNTCICPANSSWSCMSEMCCHETCQSCSQPYAENACLTCPFGANLTGNGTCECGKGFYWNPLRMSCDSCPFGCEECEGSNCTLCQPNAYQNQTSGECTCKDGYFAGGNWCWECSDACTTCDWRSNCTSCPLFSHLTGNSTCECDAGFYTMTNTSACVVCPEGEINCTSCGLNEVLIGGFCQCRLGYHFDFSTRNCTIDCAPNCLSCLSDNATECLSCEWGGVINNETHSCDCISGFYLMDGHCLSCGLKCSECSSEGQCLACVPGAFFTNATNSTCECPEGTKFSWVNESCQAYNETNSTCGQNAYYANETCLCYPGFFIPENSTECMKCSPACASCQGSADFCTSCSLFAELNVTSGQCTCTNSSYADETLGTCLPCPSECDGCTDANNCLSCKPTAERVNNTCTCPANSKWSNVSEICCHETCNSCSQPFVPDACLNCSGSAFVTVNGTCECNSGFFWNQTWMGCDNCPFGCEECDGSNCTRCQPNTYQNQTTGECSCNDGYFKAWNECSRCSDACATCDWWTNCTSCPSNSHLAENMTCECDAGFYTMTNASACILCPEGETNCTSCGPIGALVNGHCECKPGYHYDPSTWNCTIDCAPNCATCLPDNATVCLSCEWGAVLNNETHSCDCMSGFYLNSSDCVPCGWLCAECSSEGQCLACVQGASFANSTNSTCECAAGTVFDWHSKSCQPPMNETCGSNSYPLNGTCLCYPGFFSSENSTDCFKCAPSCSSCRGSADFCTSCSPFGELNATFGQCTCTNSSYADETLGVCLPCPPTCDGCTDANNCLSCKPTAERVNNTCTCPANSAWSGMSEMCCHETCLSCSQPFAVDACETCPFGANLIANGTCGCSPGFYWNETWRSCAQCPFACDSCDGPSNCTHCRNNSEQNPITGECTCTAGYFASWNSCEECASGCLNCSDRFNCSACVPSATLVNGTCQCPDEQFMGDSGCLSCDSTCETCSGSGKLDCLTCGDNAELFYGSCRCLNSSNTANCTWCEGDCAACDPATPAVCTLCFPNAHIDNSTGECECDSGTFKNSTQCLWCLPTCSECSGLFKNCTSCPANAQLTANNTCECQPGFFTMTNVTACQPCPAGQETCSSCPVNSTLNNGFCECPWGSHFDPWAHSCVPNPECAANCEECVPYNASICLLCSFGSHLNAMHECECDAGFYSNNSRCVPCGNACGNCTADGLCLGCTDGAQDVNGTCVCKPGTYFDFFSQQCSNCNSTCATCIGPGEGDCTSCKDGADFNGTWGFCMCGNNQTENCTRCEGGCAECGPFSPENCTTCPPNSHAQYDACVCDEGFFAGQNSTCVQCSAKCQTCEGSAENCTSCSHLAHLNNRTWECECTSASYLSAAGMCEACAPECEGCFGPRSDQCLTCRGGAINVNGTCACPTGTRWVEESAQCCFGTCQNCTSPAPTDCIGCLAHATRVQNFTCECLAGYFFDSETFTCSECPFSCEFCTSTDSCSVCGSNSTLRNSTCECDSGFFAGNHTCDQCSLQCRECLGESTYCTACTEKAILLNGTCSCVDGFYLEGGECVPCDSTCGTCTGPGPLGCSSCYENAVLVGGSVCQCLSSANTTNCSFCEGNCATCDLGNSTHCTQCFAGAFVNNSTGLCECEFGYFENPNATQCTRCVENCETCYGNASYCLTCAAGAFLDENLGTCECFVGYNKTDSQSACFACNPLCVSCGQAGECFECRGNSSYFNGTCSCPESHYLNESSLSCEECHAPCGLCNATDPSVCTQCLEPWLEIFNETLGTCECPDGLFRNSTTKRCERCAEGCSHCNETVCFDCTDGAEFDSKRQCQCKKGFFMGFNGTCEECDSTCLDCDGPGPLSCTACRRGGKKFNDTGACYCAEGKSGNCIACDSSCETCDPLQPFICRTCPERSVLVNGTCLCEDGYERQGNSSVCVVSGCHFSCAGCSGPGASMCTKCWDGAELVQATNQCRCADGFFESPSPASCSPCDPSCLTCSSATECQSCPAGSLLLDKSCVATCPSGLLASGGRCIPTNTALVGAFDLSVISDNVTDPATKWALYNGDTASFYPSKADTFDPIPAASRGFYYTGKSRSVFAPVRSDPTDVSFAGNFTIMAWVLPEPSTFPMTVFSRVNVIDFRFRESVLLSLSNDTTVAAVVELFDFEAESAFPATVSYTAASIAVRGWKLLALQVRSSRNSATLSLLLDGSVVATQEYSGCGFIDSPGNATSRFTTLGARYLYGNYAEYLTGFIAKFAVYSSIIDASPRTSCGCPACTDTGACLQSCGLLQYADASNQCKACASSCTSGCRRATDCKLSADPLCDTDDSFTTCKKCSPLAAFSGGKCACVQNAAVSAQTGLCACNTDFKESNGACVSCKNYLGASEVAAAFESTLTALTLTFTQAIDVSKVKKCQDVFFTETLEKLGSGAKCVWSNGGLTLTVNLGGKATILEEPLLLNYNNVLKTTGPCSFTTSILAPVAKYPTDMPIPVPAISAPESVSLKCGDGTLRLSALGSQGSGGRTMVYKWNLRIDNTALDFAAQGTYSTSNSIFVLPNGSLKAGKLEVQLSVQNGFGKEAATTTSIEIIDKRALSVSIDAGRSVTILGSDTREFRAKVQSACGDTLAWNTAWTYVSMDPATGASSDPAALNSQSNVLRVVPGSLTAGFNFVFSATVTSGTDQGSAQLKINVKKSKLIVNLNREDGEAPADKDLVLDASASVDPDLIPGDLTFSWSCVDDKKKKCKNASGGDLVTDSSKAALTLPAASLKVGAICVFTVTVSKDTRKEKKSLTINVIQGVGVDLAIKSAPFRLNGQSINVVVATIASDESTLFQWTQIDGPLALSSTPLDFPFLSFAPNSLSEGDTYTFKLTATTAKGTISSKIVLQVNRGPIGGALSLTPSSGVAMSTIFAFSAGNWADPDTTDLPITYQFSVQMEGLDLFLCMPQVDQTYQTKLFQGSIPVFVSACDSLGTCSKASGGSVTVAALGRSLLDAATRTEFEKDTRDVDQIPAMVLAYSRSYPVDTDFLDLLLSKLDSYLNSFSTISTSAVDLCLAIGDMMGNLTVASQPGNYQKVLTFLSGVATKAKSLTDSQATQLLRIAARAPMNTTQDATLLNAFVASVTAVHLSGALPQQTPLTMTGQHGAASVSCRVSSASLNSWNSTLGDVLVSMPANWATEVGIAASAVIDIDAQVWSPAEEPFKQLFLGLKQSGEYANYNLKLAASVADVSMQTNCQTKFNVTLPKSANATNVECVMLATSGWGTDCVEKLQETDTNVTCGVGKIGAVSLRTVEVPTPTPPPGEGDSGSDTCDQNYAPLGLCIGLFGLGLIATILARTCGKPEVIAVVPTERKADQSVVVPQAEPQPLTEPGEPLPPYCSVDEPHTQQNNTMDVSKSLETANPKQKTFRERWVHHHLLLSLVLRPSTAWRRVLVVVTTWTFDIFWLGVCYYAIVDSSSGEDESDGSMWSSYSGRDFGYAIFSAALGCLLSTVAFLLLVSKSTLPRRIGLVFCGTLLLVSVALTVYFNTKVCYTEGGHWAEGILWALLVDVVVLQTLRGALLAVARHNSH